MFLIIASCHYLLLKTYNALRQTRAVNKNGTLTHFHESREAEKRRKESMREEGGRRKRERETKEKKKRRGGGRRGRRGEEKGGKRKREKGGEGEREGEGQRLYLQISYGRAVGQSPGRSTKTIEREIQYF